MVGSEKDAPDEPGQGEGAGGAGLEVVRRRSLRGREAFIRPVGHLLLMLMCSVIPAFAGMAAVMVGGWLARWSGLACG